MASLFQILLAEKFDDLPMQVQAVHLPYAQCVWRGRANVMRGKHWLSQLCGWMARLPPTLDDVAVQVTISQTAQGEIWARMFGQHAMPSQFKRQGDYLHEALGPLRFLFRLNVENGGIHWRVHRAKFWKFPLPAFLFRSVHAREYEQNGKYHFEVNVHLPFAGLLVHYQGWLMDE